MLLENIFKHSTWHILNCFDNTHHFFVQSVGRKQQEAEHSAPAAPPLGPYNVQLDPLSVMARLKSETHIIMLLSLHSGAKDCNGCFLRGCVCTLLSGSGSAGSSFGMKRSTLLSEPCRL